MSCGGTGKIRTPSQEEIEIIQSVKPEIENKLGHALSTFEVMSIKSQVVAGINYFAKVKVGDNKFVHVRVYQPLPGQGHPALHGLQEKELGDPLEYFEQH